MPRPKPLVLMILDGFGHRDAMEHNAIHHASTPNYDDLIAQFPHTLISGSGEDVGLPDGQMGNSEVGHMNIGTGRVLFQDLLRISRAIESGEFQQNPVFVDLFNKIKSQNAALHIMGLCSDGGVHSHLNHIQAMIQAASTYGIEKIYVHAFLDGRDTPPKSAETYLKQLDQTCKAHPGARIASICGRFFAMDRDRRWDRISSAFNLIVNGFADFDEPSAEEAIQAAYHRGETDEFVEPTAIHNDDGAPVRLHEHDGIVFMNFRADRARQLTRAITQKIFDGIEREEIPATSGFVTLTQYAQDIQAQVAFPPEPIHNTFSEVISKAGLKQLRIAETEKYAHVTFFFSGGREDLIKGETRELIPSPGVKTYDLKPEMSAFEVTDKMVEAINNQSVDVIICNLANPDMVGHTGNFQATVKAIEAVDQCIGRVKDALQAVGGELLITADHGNAEQMFDPTTGQAHTAHTTELVPFVYMGRKAHFIKNNGILADIAPTMLYLLGLDIPKDMTGKPLLTLD